MSTIELSDGVAVEMLDRVTARIRLAMARAITSTENEKEAGMASVENALPLMVQSVQKDGVTIQSDDLFGWVLDNTESIDALIMHFTEIMQKATDPNAQGASTNTPAQAKVARQSKQSE